MINIYFIVDKYDNEVELINQKMGLIVFLKF